MRRGKYDEWLTEEGLTKIQGWAFDGLIDKQIAHNIGVSERTFTTWKTKFPSITSALKKGKEVVDREVENALLKSAVGYEYEEETYERIFNEETDKFEEVLVKRVKKYKEPNPTSMIFWLKNRKPEEWRDKRVTELEGGEDIGKNADAISKYLEADDDE